MTPLLTLVEFAEDPEIATSGGDPPRPLLLDIALPQLPGRLRRDPRPLLQEGQEYRPARGHLRPGQAPLRPDRVRVPLEGRLRRGADGARKKIPAAGADPGRRRERPPPCGSRAAWARSRRAARSPPPDLPGAPYGFSFEGEEDVVVWWSTGGAHHLAGAAERLRDGRPVRPLGDRAASCRFLDAARRARTLELAQSFAGPSPGGGLELMKEVNTYTWRTPDYMLSTVQDYRKGARGSQYHAWQATFDANAQVFTTHPVHPARRPPSGATTADRATGRAPPRCRARPSTRTWRSTSTRRVYADRRPARFMRLRGVHPRLLPAGPLRRGGARRPLDLRPQGRRLRRALLLACSPSSRRRPRGPHQRPRRPSTSSRAAAPTTSGSSSAAARPTGGLVHRLPGRDPRRQ